MPRSFIAGWDSSSRPKRASRARSSLLRAAWRFSTTRRCFMRTRAVTTTRSKCLTDAIAGIKSQTGGDGNPSALAILYEQLGHAYKEQRNFPAALEAFEEMGKLSPDSAKRARMLLIDTYRENHDIDRAIAEAKKALDESPDSPDMTVTLAMLYGEKARYGRGPAAARRTAEGQRHRSGNLSEHRAGRVARQEICGRRAIGAESRADGSRTRRQGNRLVHAGRDLRAAEKVRRRRAGVSQSAGRKSQQCVRC